MTPFQSQRIIENWHPEFQNYKRLQTRSDREGNFYDPPKAYPALLFDERGYAEFASEEVLKSAVGIMGDLPTKLNLKSLGGLSSISEYISCNHFHRFLTL